MATRIMLGQYDITGGRQNFSPPVDFGVTEWNRVMEKKVLPPQAYIPGARSYDSVLFSEWNVTAPRPNWIPSINGLNNDLFSIMRNGEGVYYPVQGVSYEQYAPNNAAVIPYSIKVDAIEQKPSSGRLVFDGFVDFSNRLVSDIYDNAGFHFVTFGCHITDIENGPVVMTVELLGGPLPNELAVVMAVPLSRPGGFYFDSRQSPRYAKLRFTSPGDVRANVIGIIGIV